MARRAMVLLAWVLSTVLAGGVAWAAVATVGRGQGASDQVLSEAQVTRALDTRRAAAASASPTTSPSPTPTPSSEPTATPDPTSTPTSRPTTPPPAGPAAVARTFTVEGGVVSATCTGSAIAFGYATANDGWAYEVKDRGPEHVEVEFAGDGTETHVRTVCVAGAPELAVEAGDSHSGGDGGGGD